MEFPKVVFIQKPAKGKDEHVVAISLTKKKFHPNEEVCHRNLHYTECLIFLLSRCQTSNTIMIIYIPRIGKLR